MSSASADGYSIPTVEERVKRSSVLGDPEGRVSEDHFFPCNTEPARWQTELKKCSCNSSWCPSCWRFLKKALVGRMRSMNWRHVREVMVSVDRSIYENGEQAFDDITLKRGVGNLIKNLQRTDGVTIVDWVCVIEWHEDGFPHWHILIVTQEEGQAGMIGYQKIKDRWPFGMWVTETYIKSAVHWQNLVGYFDKHGYFEKGKAYQGRLPEWALKRNRTIKRWHSMKKPRGQGKVMNRIRSEDKKVEGEWLGKGEKRERKTYEVILSQCGSRSIVRIDGPGWNQTFKISVRYERLKDYFPWQYSEGKGLVLRLTEEGLTDFISVLEWLGKDCEAIEWEGY